MVKTEQIEKVMIITGANRGIGFEVANYSGRYKKDYEGK